MCASMRYVLLKRLFFRAMFGLFFRRRPMRRSIQDS